MNARSLLNLRPPWKPGEQSPNPGGRPRSRPVTTEYMRVLQLPVRDLQIKLDDSGITALCKGMVIRASKGGAMAAGEITDRVEGPVTHRHDVEFIPGSELNVNISGEVTEKREVEVGPTLGEVIREIYGISPGPNITTPGHYGHKPVLVSRRLAKGQEPPKDSDEGS